jgi:hypothetical protein
VVLPAEFPLLLDLALAISMPLNSLTQRRQGIARRSRNQTETPSTQRRRGRREPQSFFFNRGWTRINTDIRCAWRLARALLIFNKSKNMKNQSDCFDCIADNCQHHGSDNCSVSWMGSA